MVAHEECNSLAQTMGPSPTEKAEGGKNSPEAMGDVQLNSEQVPEPALDGVTGASCLPALKTWTDCDRRHPKLNRRDQGPQQRSIAIPERSADSSKHRGCSPRLV